MRSLKHLFWVHHWQLVESVHPPGGLVKLQGEWIKKCIFRKKIFKKVFLPACASGSRNFGVNLPMADCLCMRKHARVVPQQGPGQEPCTAAWQAVLALGWPLPPPGCPHSLTSLAWQQQPNKLRAPQSSHRSMGMFFTAPTPLFMVIMVCVLYTNTPTCQMKSTKAGVHLGVWGNIHKLACTLHQLACLLIHVNTVEVDLVVIWVKNAWKLWHCFVAFVSTVHVGITISL